MKVSIRIRYICDYILNIHEYDKHMEAESNQSAVG